MVLGPIARHKRRLAKHRKERSIVHGSTPDPMACDLAVTLDEISQPEELAEDVKDERVIRGVEDPLERYPELEESVLLTHHVKLRVTVQEARGDELIKNAKCQRRQHSEEDVVQRQKPGLEDDLSREHVLESKL